MAINRLCEICGALDGTPHEKWCSEIAETENLTHTQEIIQRECRRIEGMLLNKNRKYGDSAIHPVRIFSNADPIEQIKVRLDDKISRINSGQTDDTEDAELDLVGYLILLRVARRIRADVPGDT